MCKARARAKRRGPTNNNPAKLFKRAPSALPQILRDAIVVAGVDGKNRIEDGQHRVLVVLAVPEHLVSAIRPGEIHVSAVVGADDVSVLDATGIGTEVPVSLIRLRKTPEDVDASDHDPERRSTQR